ncbi:ParA family protein [Curtobacterium sp. BRB10]|uniref:ParA family protein n=1 Tax=Curtobacterium sp. BRB10 TaxID=2962579 RepID=UPI0028827FF2|nr:ParA family protein [Curtobacterium sp. BRB10]MDT0235246.1 ParA family protein [Curtobacterium sp. BRB10]
MDRTALNRVIAVSNGKGGVLKTTITANIGGLLAASGSRVLLVDLDPQGNLAEDLGFTGSDRDDRGAALADALQTGGRYGATPVRTIRDNLDVFVGGPELERASAFLVTRGSQSETTQLALARVLAPIAADYDLVLIDCPPGEEALQTAAMGAAKWVLVPVKSDASSRRGFEAVANRLELVRGQHDGVTGYNPEVGLLGVVLVGVGTNSTAIRREARHRIVGEDTAASRDVFESTIRHSEATAQATRETGQLVHELDDQVSRAPKWYQIRRGEATAPDFAPRSATNVADDLQAVTEELVARLASAESEGDTA